ncbi:L-2-hydroxyglutarate oxidase [Vibrio aquimaris]|uniref:L-2-hydroxyglutarate oxidase LhgO n=1 Tax=Vibrio aquimaris TaxID=2587862 RepID=A0A5P9CRV3_9VIBR|nr:L-2-hydroxyglutarate oxidase [Vibrio aquimaris]QFT28703.1 L-2-hydroxyglutarate oxidase LhgO [Vibrio aquimaris]
MHDYIIVGGGIIGASTAWQLKKKYPNKRILLLEKEQDFAQHQTGHNSGVIHAGVYYPPNSLKAKFCKQGAADTIAFCDQHNIPVENCGKLIVATSQIELERMQALFERCQQNGIDVERLDQYQLKLAEPNITGLGALHVKQTSIVDYTKVTRAMVKDFTDLGGEISLLTEVLSGQEFEHEIQLTCMRQGQSMQLNTRYLITCSGLMADRLTAMLGIETNFQIIPYRGEYYQLDAAHNQIVNHLIYPVPDPDLPFLGVHLTKMINGSVTVGPNAVQGWKREGYSRVNFSVRDTMQMLSYKGFWRVSRKHYKTGLVELYNSWWKPAYLKQVQKYCPSLSLKDLKPYPVGIRAQAVLTDGTLVHDFLFAESIRSLHVCNAPSPAATSSIPIGSYICQKVADKFEPGT